MQVGFWLYLFCVLVPQFIWLTGQYNDSKAVLENLVNFESPKFDQLSMDWKKPFINDIYTVDEYENCKDDDEPVFGLIWFGAEHMCVDYQEEYRERRKKGIKTVYVSKGETCRSRYKSFMCKYRGDDTGCSGTDCECYSTGRKGQDFPGFPMI